MGRFASPGRTRKMIPRQDLKRTLQVAMPPSRTSPLTVSWGHGLLIQTEVYFWGIPTKRHSANQPSSNLTPCTRNIFDIVNYNIMSEPFYEWFSSFAPNVGGRGKKIKNKEHNDSCYFLGSPVILSDPSPD